RSHGHCGRYRRYRQCGDRSDPPPAGIGRRDDAYGAALGQAGGRAVRRPQCPGRQWSSQGALSGPRLQTPIRLFLSHSRSAEVTDKPLLLVVACALVDADRRVLIAQRPQGKSMAGLWEFPGGKVEPGETPEAALIRELAEELAIETRQACLAPLTFASHSYETVHLLMPVYVCRKWQGMPQARELAALKCDRP